jgi:hypothetical protein
VELIVLPNAKPASKNETQTRYLQKKMRRFCPIVFLLCDSEGQTRHVSVGRQLFFLPSKEIWRRQTQLFNE